MQFLVELQALLCKLQWVGASLAPVGIGIAIGIGIEDDNRRVTIDTDTERICDPNSGRNQLIK